MERKDLSEMSLEELWQLFPIVLTEPDNRWRNWFEDERAVLKNALGDVNIFRISHIGSTAIAGIWAKPTIDILVEVTDKNDLNVVKTKLLNCGYICMSEDDLRISFNKGYTKYGYAERVFHIHIRIAGDNDELYFRDYLNENLQLAKEYETLKLFLCKQYEHDRDGYTNAKTEFIRKCTVEAKDKFGGRYSVV